MKLNKIFELNKKFLSNGLWVYEIRKNRIFFLNSSVQHLHYIEFFPYDFKYVINSDIYEKLIHIDYEEY